MPLSEISRNGKEEKDWNKRKRLGVETTGESSPACEKESPEVITFLLLTSGRKLLATDSRLKYSRSCNGSCSVLSNERPTLVTVGVQYACVG
jgi:hypothetical protein